MVVGRLGPVLLGVLALLLMGQLLPLAPAHPDSVVIPGLFGLGTLVLALLSLTKASRPELERPGPMLVLAGSVLLYGVAWYAGVRYYLATAGLLAVCFVSLRIRSVALMGGVLAGTLLLAYGLFGFVLAVPVR